MIFSKFLRFFIFNSAKVPGIDRKWFVCVFDVLAVRSRAFARSLSFKNLPNSLKIKNLTANPLLALSMVSDQI